MNASEIALRKLLQKADPWGSRFWEKYLDEVKQAAFKDGYDKGQEDLHEQIADKKPDISES